MIQTFIKLAVRNLLRNKLFSAINISGLAIGMASAILILLWVQNEISYDKFYKDQDRLYEVWSNDVYDGQIRSSVVTPEIMEPILKNDVPQLDKTTRVSWDNVQLLTVGDKALQAKGNIVDEDFLQIFNFPVLRGDADALKDPSSLMITEKMAKKLYGSEDPIGKIVRMQNSDNFKVAAVLKDLPNNTFFNFDFLVSYRFVTDKKFVDSDWTDVSIRTFAKLKPNTTAASANQHIKNVIVSHSNNRAKTTCFLYPVSQLRLHSNFENGVPTGGLITRVNTFTIIAVLILLIACINFMNLSTARSEKRAKEVGIRKVVGAQKGSLISQFLGESLLLSVVAGLLAIAIVQIVLPGFNMLVKKDLFIDYSNGYFWLAAIIFITITGLIAGSYPAFFLSAFKPVEVLKGTFKKINALVTPRKLLVILQFSFAIALMICTIVITQQIRYAQERESGYNKKNLGYIFLQGDVFTKYEVMKNDLLSSGIASSVTRTSAPLTQNWSSGISMNWQGRDPNKKIQINRYTEDGGLVKTAGMQLVQGRDIDIKKYTSDSTACLISEAAVKAMGFKEPIGQMIFDDPVNWHVVGVIKDFILESPYESIKPFMVKGPKYGGGVMHIKFSDTNPLAKNLADAERIFKKYNSSFPFEFHFTDEEYARKFADEQLTGKLASLFAGLTIFISCLGLFGLATYMAENRIREIGVRRVLGATITSITILLSKDFLKLVIFAFLVASPIAWWVMNSWLANYPYRISMSWQIFLLAGSSALLIALITVSYQSIKAALSNPVNSLRTE